MTKKAPADMHGLKLTGGKTYSARLSVPKDRWGDVGRVYGTKSGILQERLRSLQTRDPREAARRRDKALAAMRAEIDQRLMQAGLKPLHGDWCPEWANDEELVREASRVREEMQSLSDKPRPSTREEDLSGEYIESPKQAFRSGWLDEIDDRVHELERVGADGRAYAGKFLGVLDGSETPMGPLIDRWTREREATVSPAYVKLDRAALRQLAAYIVQTSRGVVEHGLVKKDDPLASLRSRSIQSLSYRLLGGFSEWLMDHVGLSPKTTSCRISSLKSFWGWCIQKHIIDGPNPWDGATKGLKRRAERLDMEKPDRRPFTTDELVRLFTTDPDEGRRWGWGQAIRDLMPLALFTGARVNELCSLTMDRIVNRDRELWGISILKIDAKTESSVRCIPLHPLVRPIIERRLAVCRDPSDPLFPECRPEKEGRKWSATFTQRFTTFRREVLGDASDGHTSFHSFRKNFITYMEMALANGASECSELVRMHLSGHEPGDIGRKTYASRDLGWEIYSKAILGMVEKGMPPEVAALVRSE